MYHEATYLLVYILIIIIVVALFVSFTSHQEDETSTSHQEDEIIDTSFNLPVFIINLDRKPERYQYIKDQLNLLGIENYRRISAVDGFELNQTQLKEFGLTDELSARKGIAGCAASHIKVWKQIVEEDLDWCLILEDDAHFHPEFRKLFNSYWKKVPLDAKIVYPGYCAGNEINHIPQQIIPRSVMCTQGYIISKDGAKDLLNNLLPVNDPIDIALNIFYKNIGGSYIFNGNFYVNGIRPNDYKERNGRRCMFNGIIYQNHEEQGSTIHQKETIY